MMPIDVRKLEARRRFRRLWSERPAAENRSTTTRRPRANDNAGASLSVPPVHYPACAHCVRR
jgi:hypothetical protein